MKMFILATLTVFSTTVFGGNALDLDGKDVHYGPLRQATRTAALDKVEVIRTKKTPNKVDVHFSVKESEEVCAEYRYIRVWHPGHYDRVCRSRTGRDGNRRTVCRDVWRNGYYTENRRCVRWETVMVSRNKEIRLNFKKAADLSEDQREVFLIEFRQERVSSDNIKVSGQVVEARRGYQIYFETFLKNSLKFEVK